MPNKVTLELDPNEMEMLVKKLSMEDKLRLVRKLDEETLDIRMEQILKNINQRRKKHPISAKEIDRIVGEVREELYAQRHRRH